MATRSSRTVSRSAAPPSSGASPASPRSTPPPRSSSRRTTRARRWRSGRSASGATVFLLDAPVTARREVGRGTFVIAMRAPEIASTVRAGQFVNLGWSGGPLLRRPFSVYRVEGEDIEIVLKAVGTGTAQLIDMEPGDRLSCLGPLGHGFDLRGGRVVVLVSGGLGVAPMPLAARDAAE